MSYYKVFKPTKEAMEKYNVSCSEKLADVNKLKAVVYCMTAGEKDNVCNVYCELESALKGIDLCTKLDVYKRIYDQFNNEGNVWFCGWEYARESPYDKEEIIKRTIEELAYLKMVVKTPDYFDENEKFIKKKNDIEDILAGFVCTMTECCNFEIIEDLKPYIELKPYLDADESDYYDNQKGIGTTEREEGTE